MFTLCLILATALLVSGFLLYLTLSQIDFMRDQVLAAHAARRDAEARLSEVAPRRLLVGPEIREVSRG